ncbi:MAG: insulinase family protein [Chitinophagaceae bacterium]|nr:MAG: insulinase family protein [Chitinophagaceae bacterium]
MFPMTLRHTLLPLSLAASLTAGAQKAKTGASSAAKPAAAKAAAFRLPYEQFTLPNGLKVIIHEDHSDPIVAVSTVVHVGSNREKPGKTGFAHFFEHMSFNHSENTPRGASRKLVPEWGGNRNGGTWSDGTVYYEVIPKDAFEKILWMDSDRLGFMINTVTKEALAKEIQVVKNEKRQNYDNVPYGSTSEVILANLYPKEHPYNWTVIGSLPDLQAASLDDVKEFYDRYYGAANATLVIAGDVDAKKTKERVQYWFGEVRRGPAVQPLKPQPAKLTASKTFWYEDNFAKLPELTMVFPTVEQYHRDAYALNMLGQLLSGTKTAPLYTAVVTEAKLAPSVSASNQSKELAGEFYIRVRGNAGTDLDDVKKAIDAGLARFEKEGFTDTQLEHLKTQYETGLYSGLESVLAKAQRLGRDNEFKGDPGFVTKEAEIVRSLTKADVLRVYNQYIKGKNYIATAFVPKGKKDLALSGAEEAKVWTEPIVNGVAVEDVDPGEDAKFVKTKTKNDRSEPGFGEMPLFRMPQVWTGSMANGMRLYGIESREVPLVNFEVVIPGGHWADPIDKSGVSALLAGLMTQGTASKTPAELEAAIDALGATINVSSGNEELRIRATCLARNFAPTMKLVQEILLQPRWDKTEYERLYKATQTAIQGREANATAIAALNFNKLLYGEGHILGIPAQGTKESVSRITLDDLKQYFNTWVKPSAAVVHVAGAVPQEEAVQTIAVLAQNWNGTAPALPAYTLPQQDKAGTLYFIDVPGAKQSVLYVGKLGVSAKDPEATGVSFANEVLGVNSSSRLFQTLRIGKGYTYGAQSAQQRSAERAPFQAVTSVRANATLPSLQIIQDMIRQYGTTFTEKEVELTKNKVLKGSTLDYETLGAKLGLLNDISKYKRPLRFVEQDQQQLMKMSLADYRNIIGRHFNEADMVYVVVGDKATQLEEVKKLGKKVVQLDSAGNPVTF